MKKTLFILAFLFSATQMFAQVSLPKQTKGTATFMEINPISAQSAKTNVILDTLNDHVERCSGPGKLVLYGNVAGGYLSGTSATFDGGGADCDFVEEGQTFFATGTNRLTDVYVWFGAKRGVGVDDDYEVKVYNGRGGTPTLLGSTGYNFGQVQASNQSSALFANRFQFNPTISVSDSFMIGIEVKNANSDDTLGIVTSNPDSACGASENRFWQKIFCPSVAFELWDAAANFWVGGFNADLMVLAVVDIDQTTGKGTKSGDVRVFGCYPNPACNSTKILFELDKSASANVRIMSLDGRIVKSDKFNANAGLNEYTVDVNDLANGTYIYTVQTAKGQISSKLSISK